MPSFLPTDCSTAGQACLVSLWSFFLRNHKISNSLLFYMKLQFLWTHNRNVVYVPYACVWTYIEGEWKVLLYLSEVRCWLECKWRRLYSNYGYNNCCRILPRACDEGYVCWLNGFMYGTFSFRHNARQGLSLSLCTPFLTKSILFMKTCLRNIGFRLQNDVTECEIFVPNSCVVRTSCLNIATFVPLPSTRFTYGSAWLISVMFGVSVYCKSTR